ncbi:MAG: hypothetical protein EOO46_14380 [Flavobacterium sp.]|nr:MAG: hypothetical protein EOO46_14380 [Flavobacterium sp.]
MIENRIFDDASAAKGQDDSIIYKSDGQKRSARLHKISLLSKVIFEAIMKNIFRVSLLFIFLALSRPAQSQTDLTDLQIEQVRNVYREGIQGFDAAQTAELKLLDTIKNVTPTEDPNYREAVGYYLKLLHYRASFQIESARDKTLQQGLASIEQYYANNTDYIGKKYFKALFLLEIFSKGYIEAVSTSSKLLEAVQRLRGVPEEFIVQYDFGSISRLFARIPLAEKKVGFRPFKYKIEDALLQLDYTIGNNGNACDNYLIKIDLLREVKAEKHLSFVRAQANLDIVQYAKDIKEGGFDHESETLYFENIPCTKKLLSGKDNDIYSVDRLEFSPVPEHEYKIDVEVPYTSRGSLPPTIKIELYCDLWEGNEKIKPYEIRNFSTSQRSTASLRSILFSISTRSVPCHHDGSLFALFDAGPASKTTAHFISKPLFLGLIDSAFLKSIKDEYEKKSKLLIDISFNLTNFALAQPNMFCILQKATLKKTLDDGVLQNLKTEYFNLFAEEFDLKSTEYSCPPVTTLIDEIAKCNSPSGETKSFCSEYREYSDLTNWFNESIKLINERINRLNSEEKIFKEELETLRGEFLDDLDSSENSIG